MIEHIRATTKIKCPVRLLSVGAMLLLLCALRSYADDGAEVVEIDYAAQVQPLLVKYCVGCHAADEPEGQLVLESYSGLRRGGEHGAAIVPGKSAASRMIQVLTGKAEPAMPPKGSEAPTSEEVALLVAWIDAGAAGPTDADGAGGLPLVVPSIDPRVVPPESIYTAAFSPDGKQLALGQYQTVRVVDTAARSTIRLLSGLTGPVNDLAFVAEGKQLLTASGEPGAVGELTRLDAASGKELSRRHGHRNNLYALAVSPDGQLIATGGYDHEILLWRADEEQPFATLTGHNGAVFDLAFRGDGRVLASASADRTVKLWDTEAARRLDTLSEATKELYAVAFSPDGSRLIAGGVDRRIRLWSVSSTAAEDTNPIQLSRIGHLGAVIELAWSADGKTIVSSAEDGTVKIWDAAELRQRTELPTQSDWPVALAVSPDSKQLCVGRLDGTFGLFELQSAKPMPMPKPELASVAPRGIQRGKATRLQLHGKYLSGATKIDTGNEKLTATVVPPESSNVVGHETLVVEITPAADLVRGKYELAVVTPGGTSKKLPLYVDDLPQTKEQEPNDLVGGDPQALQLPGGLWGAIDRAGDVDVFAFEASGGAQVVIDLSATVLESKLDGMLTLYGPDGRVVATNNDFDDGKDPLLAYDVPEDGTYRLQVSSLTAAGSGDHFYRLSIGEFAYVTGAYPLGIAANEATTVELAGFNLPDDAQVSVEPQKPGKHRIALDRQRYRGRESIEVVVGDLADVREVEPNDNAETATALPVPVMVNGRIYGSQDDGTDADLFRFAAKAGEPLVLEVEAARLGSPVDTRIEILWPGGQPVQRTLLQATRDSWISFRGIDSNTQDVRVANWEEMELNELLYFQGEVNKIFRLRRGPDSGFLLYGWKGKRIGYFDTSPTSHALDEPAYIVTPQPPGAELIDNGLPVFPLYYANDDDGRRDLGRDSKLLFTAPKDGEYLVRVTDVRGLEGDRFGYRLTLREARPDFRVTVGGANPKVPIEGGRTITFTVDRIDGFDGPVTVDVDGLPEGFTLSTPVVIEAGHFEGHAVLRAESGAKSPKKEDAAKTKVTATAEINGSPVVHEAGSLGTIARAGKGKVQVWLEPQELTIAPGGTTTATIKVKRNNFKDRVSFELFNLPHGVIVDNIGLNGVLIPEGETERQIFLSCRDWVPESTRNVHAVAINADRESSASVVLHVRRQAEVAQASGDGQ